MSSSFTIGPNFLPPPVKRRRSTSDDLQPDKKTDRSATPNTEFPSPSQSPFIDRSASATAETHEKICTPDQVPDSYTPLPPASRNELVPPQHPPTILKYTAATLLPPEIRQNTIQQQNIGDCYLLAVFDALRHSPVADTILNQIQIEEVLPADLIEEDSYYIVQFPSGLTGTVQTMEIGQERDGKQFLQGSWGWQILELAYAKATRSERNRERNNPFKNDGRGHTPEIVEAGTIEDALFNILGGEKVVLTCTEPTRTKPFMVERGGFAKLLLFLREVQRDPTHHYIMGAVTPATTETENTIELTKMGDNEPVVLSFLRQHAYSIRSFNLANNNNGQNTITVADPHDTGTKVYTLSLDDFCKAFCQVAGIKLPRNFGDSQEFTNIQHTQSSTSAD